MVTCDCLINIQTPRYEYSINVGFGINNLISVGKFSFILCFHGFHSLFSCLAVRMSGIWWNYGRSEL